MWPLQAAGCYRSRQPDGGRRSNHRSRLFRLMKGHIGVDADLDLAHTVRGATGSFKDVVEAYSLLHEQDTDVLAGASYHGAHT